MADSADLPILLPDDDPDGDPVDGDAECCKCGRRYWGDPVGDRCEKCEAE